MRFHAILLSSALFAALGMGPAFADSVELNGLEYTMSSCIDNSSGQPRECVGQGVKACREGLQHGSNVAMIGCIFSELTYWERQIDIGQAPQIVRAAKFEADRATIGASYVDLIDMTKDAFKAWHRHRDTSCDVELAYWTGGSGGGSVVAQCKLELTAEQAIRLSFGDGWGASNEVNF